MERGDVKAYYLLANLYLLLADSENKLLALTHIRKAIESSFNPFTLVSLAKIALWNDEIIEAKEAMQELLQNWIFETEVELLNKILMNEKTEILLFFLVKDQTNLVDQWLQEFDLREQFKPLYYTLMHLMKDKYPDAYLRMGPEMQETVEEMLAEIEALRIKYA